MSGRFMILMLYSMKFVLVLKNELLPPAERQPNQTDKEETGPFNREHLLKHMAKEAIESTVGDNYLPFKKETRGRVWKPKPKRPVTATILPDDLSEALDGASVDEIAELAGIPCSLMVASHKELSCSA